MAASANAAVTPRQAWGDDGTADVTPSFPTVLPTRNLPLEHRPKQGQTVARSAYPNGLVILWTGGPTPPSSPVTLPLVRSSGEQVTVGENDMQEWPDGFVIWFDAM